MLANSEYPDQTPHNAVSDLGLHFWPMSHKKDDMLTYVNNSNNNENDKNTVFL